MRCNLHLRGYTSSQNSDHLCTEQRKGRSGEIQEEEGRVVRPLTQRGRPWQVPSLNRIHKRTCFSYSPSSSSYQVIHFSKAGSTEAVWSELIQKEFRSAVIQYVIKHPRLHLALRTPFKESCGNWPKHMQADLERKPWKARYNPHFLHWGCRSASQLLTNLRVNRLRNHQKEQTLD